MKFNEKDSLVLLLGQVGSKAYGTNTESSDDDFMAVVLAPLSCYTGLDKWENDGSFELKKENGNGEDAIAYELHKFSRLCLQFNPNVIPLLYLSDYIMVHPAGQTILDNKDAFISLRCYDTFIGYAKSQMSNVRKGITGKYGSKRKALIEKYGFDTKFAAHTIRLLRMVGEFFYTGHIQVNRTEIDADELLSIRRGEWTEDEFFLEAEKIMKWVEDAKNLNPRNIPKEPDYARVNRIVMEIISQYTY